ncbi:hypothetical protein VPNG_10176 [Cytospora leucostoma]|uniref:Uncharacterized protein n=1 Tax=Cytospora leucostoma TaxID=1230097 RepID=A0A423VFP5_9PEZI|nr:hypothetical protein VPNG_10176 [Cytospora leucostoma]
MSRARSECAYTKAAARAAGAHAVLFPFRQGQNHWLLFRWLPAIATLECYDSFMALGYYQGGIDAIKDYVFLALGPQGH